MRSLALVTLFVACTTASSPLPDAAVGAVELDLVVGRDGLALYPVGDLGNACPAPPRFPALGTCVAQTDTVCQAPSCLEAVTYDGTALVRDVHGTFHLDGAIASGRLEARGCDGRAAIDVELDEVPSTVPVATYQRVGAENVVAASWPAAVDAASYLVSLSTTLWSFTCHVSEPHHTFETPYAFTTATVSVRPLRAPLEARSDLGTVRLWRGEEAAIRIEATK